MLHREIERRENATLFIETKEASCDFHRTHETIKPHHATKSTGKLRLRIARNDPSIIRARDGIKSNVSGCYGDE